MITLSNESAILHFLFDTFVYKYYFNLSRVSHTLTVPGQIFRRRFDHENKLFKQTDRNDRNFFNESSVTLMLAKDVGDQMCW